LISFSVVVVGTAAGAACCGQHGDGVLHRNPSATGASWQSSVQQFRGHAVGDAPPATLALSYQLAADAEWAWCSGVIPRSSAYRRGCRNDGVSCLDPTTQLTALAAGRVVTTTVA